ncbi:MAG: acyl-CoA dehydratase activase [Candidatus Heimdallarchaeum aukensis]|uniref:Acyl-CoA dehydratase activase n=1 Tax=Candidatus Heimdallarchaeum aukensis TaxID=2876573 RepID=A0A9Y1FJQ1_9ARCH|nr:MAG: acyl-CoA dehydratase activase [Candidatus Heimdallarchaeum aukensis]
MLANVGINIGSVSVNFVFVDTDGTIHKCKKPHMGKPQEVLTEIIKENIPESKKCAFATSGSFGNISEIAAIERGLKSYPDEKFDIVLSLGGESFVLYVIDEENNIVNILSHDKCAAGSGEFFLQQIGRLGLSLNEAIERAKNGKKIQLASRCSVHCKSDITHKLNKGEASIDDILTSVLSSMVNKVLHLIMQSRVNVKRLLVIGGVTLNDTFVQLLREELPDVDVVIKDVSSVFEAYGASLMVSDNPLSFPNKPVLKTEKSFATLPPLKEFREQVTIIEPKPPKTDFDESTIFVLGVDVGSTTTKAVLMDYSDNEIVASYYGRTQGNPVNAAKKCITEIIKQVGNQRVQLIGVTGSGRQIVGAYLGTPAIYNEISAHSTGAVHFDDEVDTIFEIGGQDSKYMLIKNGVPIDYAMNASCSAGTGSFLEECSKGDLGISVYDIASVAMQAENPVRFKADCAAFINSDIRTALQEGYSRTDIVGGLVYSIVNNYVEKVKGSREVGKKIFFQGGVAKNTSVGYAFAQATGKHIIIPPNPELVGAFGVALIAKEKYELNEIGLMPENTSLEHLIKEEMKHLGHFICKACNNYCQIERYEVGGRRFPFGGRCSRYEHQWRRTEKIKEKEDLVQKRNDLIFENVIEETKTNTNTEKIGIPRALLTHSLFPLYSTFFKEIGFEVVLSSIDEEKELLTNAPFCYPVQILHGAVNDLIKKGIKLIFLPHIRSLPKNKSWFDSTFCPITQGSSYYIPTTFSPVEILNPVLDFEEGYEYDTSLVDYVVKKLGIPKSKANRAYIHAVKKQKKVEQQFIEWGKEALKKLDETNETAIVLVGRSYNAFPPETSQLIPKKLASMGVTVIPFDFLEKVESEEDIPWYFINYINIAADLVQKKKNLFLLYITNFSCTIDGFNQQLVRTKMKSKPYLILELDAHTADAGTQTRLEAFLEIIKNYRAVEKQEEEKEFKVCQVKRRNGKTVVFTSKGEMLSIRDPRVKLYFPSFSKYHTDALSKVFSLLGYNTGKVTDIRLDYPVTGLQYSSGKECIPLAVVLGHILHLVKQRKPGEVIGYYMIRGGSPCAVYSYFHYIERFLKENKIEDVFVFRFDYLTNFMDTSLLDVMRYFPQTLIIADLMNEIESALHVVGDEKGLEQLHSYWKEYLTEANTLKKYKKLVPKLVEKIASIERKGDPKTYSKVLISGDFYVRFSPFFIGELRDMYKVHDIIVKSHDLWELVLYSVYSTKIAIAQRWKKGPNKFSTLIYAFSKIFDKRAQTYLLCIFSIPLLEWIEKRQRKAFRKTGLLYAGVNKLKPIFRFSKPYISPLIVGEAIPTVGKGIETLTHNGYDSLILTGPMNCLPYKVSQAILKPIFLENRVPFLVFDVDISSMSTNMKRLVHANIEQIKKRNIN